MKNCEKPIYYDNIHDILTCPNCGSHKVTVKPDTCFNHWHCHNCDYFTYSIIVKLNNE